MGQGDINNGVPLMSFALQHSILPSARFSRAADVAEIARHGVAQAKPAPLGKGDALARIRAQLATQRN